MKALYVPLAVLAGLLAFSLWTGHYVEERAAHWETLLGEADRLAREERWEETAEQLQKAQESWDKSRSFLHTVMEHEELDQAESLFAAAFAACDEEDVPDFHTALAQLSAALDLLAETQQVSIKNIF